MSEDEIPETAVHADTVMLTFPPCLGKTTAMAKGENVGPFSVRETRTFFAPEEDRVALIRDERGRLITFGSRSDAQAYIDDLDGQIYREEHNECGRPDYEIVSTAQALEDE